MQRSKSKNKKSAIIFSDILICAALIAITAIMPLIVNIIQLPMPPELISIKGEESYLDAFSFWKGMIVGICALVVAFYWLSDMFTNAKIPNFKVIIKQTPVFLSLIYLAFVIISAIFSRYNYTSWLGTYMRSEGALMWLAYFVIFFTAMYYVRGTGYAKVILYGLIFSSVIMGAIGVGQLFGYDFYNTQLASFLVIGRRGTINSIFEIAHGTLFNPNTFGKYTAMMTPILFLSGLTYSGKKYVNGLFFLAGVLMLLSVFGSSSLGGLIGIVTAVGVLIFTVVCGLLYRLKQERSENKILEKIGIGAVSVSALMILAIIFITPINNRVTFLFDRLETAIRAETVSGYDYRFDGGTMTVYRAGDEIYNVTITQMGGFSTDGIIIRDSYGSQIPVLSRNPEVFDDGGTQILPPSYVYEIPGYGLITIANFGIAFHVSNFFLTLENNRIYGIWVNNQELIDLSEPVPAWGFYGRETWGSSRGYIWSRSFPLMPRTAIIGTGPDTFINVFPSYDMIGTQRFFNSPYKIVDKAHNLFIQTWITTGGISAIALFSLFGHYLFTTFISLVKAKDEPFFSYGLRLGLLTGISAFVMSSMATDSTIGSTGVFFVLLGMGYGLNRFIKTAESTQ